jgi:hypothetical protein
MDSVVDHADFAMEVDLCSGDCGLVQHSNDSNAFWIAAAASFWTQLTRFLKNVAMFGGSLMIIWCRTCEWAWTWLNMMRA